MIGAAVTLVSVAIALSLYFGLRRKPPAPAVDPPAAEAGAKRSTHRSARVGASVLSEPTEQPVLRTRGGSEPDLVQPTLSLPPTEYQVVSVQDSPRAYVYRPRERTLFCAAVKRFVMPFHGVRYGPLVLGSVKLHRVSEVPEYVYDSHSPRLLLPQVEVDQEPDGGAPAVLECSARYFEYYFYIHNTVFRIMVNISHRGEFGDLLLANEAGEYEWYDTETRVFSTTRPESSATAVPGRNSIKSLSRRYAVFVPINILNTPRWPEGASCAEIDFFPATAIAFTAQPPDDVGREWIMEHLSHTALTSAIDVTVTMRELSK
jgi:hypothetical protein